MDKRSDFELEGHFQDEIVFEFVEEGKKLFVSRSFMFRASPVFKAMFENDSKEKQDGVVKIQDHSFDDFKEFLMCLDPGTLRKIEELNVLRIANIADKYLNEPLIQKCKRVMEKCLTRCETVAKGNKKFENHPPIVLKCLRILHKAEELNYKDVAEKAIEGMVKFSSRTYSIPLWQDLRSPKFNGESHFGYYAATQTKADQKVCCELFSSLPDDIKLRITAMRLDRLEDDEYIG